MTDVKKKTIKVWPETHKKLSQIKFARGHKTLSETIQKLADEWTGEEKF